MRIALIEDDRTLAYALKRYFEQEGYETSLFFSLQEALMMDFSYDFYCVDITLGDGLGYDFVTKLRTVSNAPLMFLTAKDDEANVIQGFDSGGDDYITKPFSLVELKKRIDALLRRSQAGYLHFQDLKIDTHNAIVTYQDEVIHLSVQEYRILLLLMRHPQQIVTRQMLNDHLNIVDDLYQENTLNVAMRRLRAKLADYVTIETIHKKGYTLKP